MRPLALLVALLTACAGIGPALVEGAVDAVHRGVGLEERTYLVDFFRVRVLERAPASTEAPLVVLVHGFTGDATNWDLLVPSLPRAWGLLVVELPGHGGTTPRRAGDRYDIEAQAERLAMLLEQRGRARVHLVGTSMGGHIVALVAARYPDRVASLTLAAAAGVTTPEKTEAMKRFAAGDNAYRVTNREEYRAFLELVFHTPPDLPDFALDYSLAQRVRDEPWNQQLRDSLGARWVPMEPLLPRVRAPALIVWGADDRVIHPSGARVYDEGLPTSERHVIPSCGHALIFECPEAVADLLVPFVERVTPRRR